jgi:hypothetical protein
VLVLLGRARAERAETPPSFLELSSQDARYMD